MAVDMLSPGVLVRELDYSDYVTSASSCTVGMIGEARRGPIGVPTLITTQKEMVATFGEPTEGRYGVYSALAYLTTGNSLYYVRVVQPGSKATAGTSTDKLTFEARFAGKLYNGIQIGISAPDAEGLFNVTITDANGDLLESFNGLSGSLESPSRADSVINVGSGYVTATLSEEGTIGESNFVLDGGDDSGSYSRAGVEGVDRILVRSKEYDSTLNGCTVTFSEMSNGYFNITVMEHLTAVESWISMSLDPEDERFAETFINARSSRIVVTVDTSDTAPEFEPKTLVFTGGDDGIEGIDAHSIVGNTVDGSGLYAFSNPEVMDIDILATPGWSDIDVINTAIGVCEYRADCMYVCDPPFGMSSQQVVEWANGTGPWLHAAFDTSYAALYWPWVKISDSYTRKNIWLPPSGYVIAQYAHNDKVSYPWYAPAGLNRGKMTKPLAIEHSPTPGERDVLYGNRNIVNPLTNFLSDGIVIWGQKTMQRKPTALDRINVRRLLNYLKKVILMSTRYFVFEQNDEATWDRWQNMVDPIMRQVKEQGGVYDYKIEVEPTVQDIENNRMPCVVKVKPTKAAEFIPLDFMIMPTGTVFGED